MCDTGYTVRELAADLRDMKAQGLSDAQIFAEAPDLVKRLLLMKHNWLRTYMTAPPGPGDGAFSRYKLHEEPDHSFMLLVVTLAPGRDTDPHDHGTWAVVGGLEGRETNRRWKRTDNGDVQPSGDEVVEAGSILSVPPGAIHSLHNDSGAASVTLQLYGTNLEFTQHRNYTPRRPS
jgi:predicted metal-dependent enzyme (double-stranded beta helix superfamily)